MAAKAFLIVTSLVAYVQCIGTYYDLYRNDHLCTSVDCLEAAYKIKKMMNFSIDPCQDFNEFVCGRFITEERIPDDKSHITEMSFVNDHILEDGRDILEQAIDDKVDNEPEKIAKKLYKSCIDVEAREKIGIEPMKKIVDSYGGFPTKAEPKLHWTELMKSIYEKHGFDGDSWIVSLGVWSDEKDSTRRSMKVDQPSFGFNREFLVKGLEDKAVVAYKQFMLDIAELFGTKITKDVKKRIGKVLDFEIKLAKAATPKEERRDHTKLYNPKEIKEMGKLPGGNGISWHEYVNYFFKGIHDIPEDEVVVVRDPDYFDRLGDILGDTDSKVINDYVMWRTIKFTLTYLNKEAALIKQRFRKVARGQNTDKPQWKKCAEMVGFGTWRKQGINLAAGSLYIKSKFSREAKASMERMVEFVKRAFREVVDKLDWMDEATKERAYTKLDAMREVIAYPDEILDAEKMNAYHAELIEGMSKEGVEECGLLCKRLEINKWYTRTVYDKLRKPVVVGDWRDVSVALANAFYMPNENRMEFPAGFLRGAMFNYNLPPYLNYAGIGGVIGHEISHGFDDQGRQYDEKGNLHQWWTESTDAEFNKRKQCVIDQYTGFEVEQVGMNLNGVATQGENIADIVGFKIAYKAYEYYVKDAGKTGPGLPGLPFTAKQLFWIRRAHTTCAKYTDAKLKSQILTAGHSPWEFRTNGPAMNNYDFARDFHCKSGEPMNPEEKCVVW